MALLTGYKKKCPGCLKEVELMDVGIAGQLIRWRLYFKKHTKRSGSNLQCSKSGKNANVSEAELTLMELSK